MKKRNPIPDILIAIILIDGIQIIMNDDPLRRIMMAYGLLTFLLRFAIIVLYVKIIDYSRRNQRS